jgi:hypothetical protein
LSFKKRRESLRSLKVEILEQKEAPRAGFELGGVVCERLGPHLRMAAAVKRGYIYAEFIYIPW